MTLKSGSTAVRYGRSFKATCLPLILLLPLPGVCISGVIWCAVYVKITTDMSRATCCNPVFRDACCFQATSPDEPARIQSRHRERPAWTPVGRTAGRARQGRGDTKTPLRVVSLRLWPAGLQASRQAQATETVAGSVVATHHPAILPGRPLNGSR